MTFNTVALPKGEGTSGIGTVRWPRLVPKDPECAESLKKRTLTNLYNERPTWLANAHRKLDEAVLAAYGWPADLAGLPTYRTRSCWKSFWR